MAVRTPGMSSRQATISFSGHETFVFRHSWMKKAVDGVLDDPTIFGSDNAMLRLGVGKNMVRSIRHWALATQVLEEVPRTRGTQLAASPFGLFLFGPEGKDPYLEDPNSLWLLHWKLVTNQLRSTTWSWAFNLFPSNELTRDALAVFLQVETCRKQVRIASENSLLRDVDCFFRTYIPTRGAKGAVAEESLDCPLVELGLLRDTGALGAFQFRRGPQPSLSEEPFVACLLEFWERVAPARETLSFTEVAYGFGSPGLAFKLDENSLADRLEGVELATRGVVSYIETSGLKQLYRRGRTPTSELLERYYERSVSTMFAGV